MKQEKFPVGDGRPGNELTERGSLQPSGSDPFHNSTWIMDFPIIIFLEIFFYLKTGNCLYLPPTGMLNAGPYCDQLAIF